MYGESKKVIIMRKRFQIWIFIIHTLKVTNYNNDSHKNNSQHALGLENSLSTENAFNFHDDSY